MGATRLPDPPDHAASRLVEDGTRVVRVRSEPKCHGCRGEVRDQLERWLLLRYLKKGDDYGGPPVTADYITRSSPGRVGTEISLNTIRGHQRNHMRFVRDTTAINPHLTEAERTRQAVPLLEERDAERKAADGGYEPGGHQRFLEEVVQMGRARIHANPAAVTVDHALAAAKELSRLKQDENRAELIRALAQAGAVRIGTPEVQHALEAEVSELVES